MPNFMLLATGWGPKHGGINAFNLDFATGLAEQLGSHGKTFCSAFRPSKAEIEEAHTKRVHLFEINRPPDSSRSQAIRADASLLPTPSPWARSLPASLETVV